MNTFHAADPNEAAASLLPREFPSQFGGRFSEAAGVLIKELAQAHTVPIRGDRNMNQPINTAAPARTPEFTFAPPATESMPDASIGQSAERSDASNTSWDEAFLRVESYLHAHRIDSRLTLNRLTNEIIEEARARAIERPDESPVVLAMEVVRDRMARWFGKIFVEEKWADEKFRAKGRLALILADMPQSWAPRFLHDETLPPEIAQQLLKMELQPGPEIRLSKMPPAELEFGFGDNDEKSPAGQRWALHPALGVSVVIFGLMGVAWFASR